MNRPPLEFSTPEERFQWVFAEHEKGRTLSDLAEVLGVSESRAGQLSRKVSRLANPSHHWHTGLSRQTANRLLECGFASREGVDNAVKSGEITDKPSASQRALFASAGQKTSVPGLGSVGISELRGWLGLEANTQDG